MKMELKVLSIPTDIYCMPKNDFITETQDELFDKAERDIMSIGVKLLPSAIKTTSVFICNNP